MEKTRSSARRTRAQAAALLVAAGALAAACGSSGSSDLFGDPDPRHAGGSAGAVAGQAGVFGFGGGSGFGGVSGAGTGAVGGGAGAGRGGAGGNSSGSGGAGVGGNGGSSGAGAGAGAADAGSAGGSLGVGGAGGSLGVGGAGGTSGSGGADGAGTGGTSGSGGTDGAGTGGTSGGAGSDAAGGSGGAGGNATQPPCVTKPSQVVLIGDSYVNWGTHTFQADLARESGETWRMYAIGGASMATGGITTMIPAQFENAVRADRDIRVVVMDGGGNDILVPASSWVGGSDCKNSADAPSLAVCRQIVQTSLEREQVLMERMADVGVKDVVFFFYPIVPNNTFLGGRNPNAIATWALPQVKAGCDATYERTGGRLRCHFVDMVPVFQDHPDYFTAGDIHPNTKGSAAMAKTIWATMKSACIAQKASSGCCQP